MNPLKMPAGEQRKALYSAAMTFAGVIGAGLAGWTGLELFGTPGVVEAIAGVIFAGMAYVVTWLVPNDPPK